MATPEARFWSKVDRAEPGACWQWLGGRRNFGYGSFWVDGESMGAHRFSFALAHPEIEITDLVVRHSCDNPPRVNPAHLLGGTRADNNADRAARGRSNTPRGERNPAAIYSAAVVRAIRSEYAAGVRQVDLVRKYGMSRTHVSQIVNRTRRCGEEAAS